MDRHISRFVWLACVAWLLTAGLARADKLTDAEELFRRAKGLMADNKHDEACPLLEESQKLDPQTGTLLNLAICHENIGRLASAWGEFRAVEQQARAANREDRVKLAHDRAEKLEARLTRIKIVVPADARVPGLVVKVDGEIKAEPLWSGVAVDPGTRTIEASAPGRHGVTLNVEVDGEGGVVPVTIPKLEDEPALAPAPIGRNVEREEDYAANRSRKTTGFLIGGLGVATVAAGGIFGALAIINDGDAANVCPQPCYAGSHEARAADANTDRALVFANVANVAIPVGLVAAAIGGYMVLTAGPTKTRSARSSLSPRAGGLSVGATF